MYVPKIPAFYRAMLLWVEPFFAGSGSLMAIFDPARYLVVMTPHVEYTPKFQILLDQIGAVYILFAWCGAVVLRSTDDVKVWRSVVSGMLVCDAVHIWATVKELGVNVITNPAVWRADDWVNNVTLVSMFTIRAAFLLGVGFRDVKQKRR